MLLYLTKEPKIKKEKNGAILLIHGFGSNEADLFSFAHQLPQDLYVFSVRAPYKLDFGGYAWYDIYLDETGIKKSDNQQALDSMYQLSDFVDGLILKYNLDTNNFHLLGFSQGSILSYSLALHFPEKFKKIIALSGYINEAIMPINNKNYNNLSFYISHGKLDAVIPIEVAQKTPKYLSDRNISFLYEEFYMGHEVSLECLQNMINWIS